jgi:hypothetical protein
VLRISGFGRVEPVFDAATGRLSYQIPQRLRAETCAVQLSFRHAGSKENEVIGWTFRVDPLADYLSSQSKSPESKDPAAVPAPTATPPL